MKRLAAAALAASFALAGAAPLSAGEKAPAPLERLLIKDACTDNLFVYGEGLDRVDPALVASSFAKDGVWSADGKVLAESREGVLKIWEGIAANKRPTVGRHAINNIRWKVIDGDNAEGTALVQQHRYNPDKRDEIASLATMMLVELTMGCTRTDDGWRFSRLDLQAVSIAGYRHGEN